MNLIASSLLLTLTVTAGSGCGLLKINGTSLGGGGPSLTSGEGSPTEADSPIGSPISLPSTGGGGGKTLADLAAPSENVPVTSWTPAQQYMSDDTRAGLGFYRGFGSLALADELGGTLSQLGRISLIEECLGAYESDAKSALQWALCGDDVRAVDLGRADAEMRAAGIGGEARKQKLDDTKVVLAHAAKLGAAVEAAAKTDPGIAAILATAKAARAEWKDYASTHPDVIANVSSMQGAARVGKATGFAGCAEKTRPAFEKVVRATKFVNGDHRDPLVYYVGQLRGDLDSHLVTLAYAACAAGLDESAEGLYAAIGTGEAGEVLRGERTLAFARLWAPSFKPKFSNRRLFLDDMRSDLREGGVRVSANAIAAAQTPSGGEIAKVTKNGAKTTLSFKGEQLDKCAQWRETNKISSIDRSGDVHYQQECVRREAVASQTGDVEIATMFAAGLAPGMTVTTVNNFPVAAWTAKKTRVFLGVALK